jgi:hypothetical protein
MKRLVTALALAAMPVVAVAQIKIPQASPAAVVSQEIGISSVKITYHRPGVKGRAIWGGLVPYGKVWRLGANEATTIELSTRGKIAGKEIAAGKYALFAIPAEKEWTFIVNKGADEWGAFSYKEADDVFRFKANPRTGEPAEYMQFTIMPDGPAGASVEMAWGTVRVSFPVEFDTSALVWKGVDEAVAKVDPKDPKGWQTYLNAARYAVDSNQRLDDGLGWIGKAMATESFWNYEVKAQLLHAKGNDKEAIPTMEKALELEKGKIPQEHIDDVQKMLDGWKSGKK